MATTKLYDLAVKTGEYTNGHGQTKGRYENIGSVMRGDDGGQFLLLKKTFNPAGVQSDKDQILVSCFEPKPRDNQQGGGSRPDPSPGGPTSRDLASDHIPF